MSIWLVVVLTAIALFVGATFGTWIACLCSMAASADCGACRARIAEALAGIAVNARYGLAVYPDATDGTQIVDVPLTAGECRAILALVDHDAATVEGVPSR